MTPTGALGCRVGAQQGSQVSFSGHSLGDMVIVLMQRARMRRRPLPPPPPPPAARASGDGRLPEARDAEPRGADRDRGRDRDRRGDREQDAAPPGGRCAEADVQARVWLSRTRLHVHRGSAHAPWRLHVSQRRAQDGGRASVRLAAAHACACPCLRDCVPQLGTGTVCARQGG
jgi:hypothetical protein